MTEKQINDCLSRCYFKKCFGNKFESIDEWYTSDDECIWIWYRQTEDKTYRMTIDPETKEIKVATHNGAKKYFNNENADTLCVYLNGEY